MAEHVVPHFHNDAGVDKIRIGVKEFQCMGASPPFDHPHVFLDMGKDQVARAGRRKIAIAARDP